MQLPSLNKPQRAALLIAAAVVAVIQLMYFDDNGIDGMGWIVSIIVIAAFCVLALRSDPKPGFRVAWTDQDASKAADPRAVERNLAAISRAADNIGARVRRKLPDADTNKGRLSVVTASVTRSALLMYGLGLLAVCKLRHDGDFLNGEEYRDTKRAIMKAAASADNVILKDAAPQKLVTPDSYASDLREVEQGIVSFFRALAAHNTDSPAALLNAWLDRRSSIPTMLSPTMESIAREEMRLMYTSLFDQAP